MKQKYVLGAFAMTLMAVLGLSIVSAFAFGGDFMNQEISDEDHEEMQEHMQAIQDAIAEGDYETWKSLMEERITEMQEYVEDESNFDALVERHEKMEEQRESMEDFCEENNCPDLGEAGFREGPRRGHFEMMPPLEESE